MNIADLLLAHHTRKHDAQKYENNGSSTWASSLPVLSFFIKLLEVLNHFVYCCILVESMGVAPNELLEVKYKSSGSLFLS